ncbi:MAG TPA: tripartite tricarboxylate transporter substrate binding protein BugD [Xanthobacteraceae bacterium]|jgi:tripartite-type tricarboxylate transporter receptor subunit TctC|nr:tripartite tricarboxylate transporter substrate binding protein BugD [Xanthobacteraceae bacterium]
MRKWLLASVVLLAGGFSAASAQDYPTRNITMMIPFAAGGPTDTVGRLVAESMAKTLGKTIVVENLAGAGGTRASGQLAKAEPDGYTILLHHIGMSTAPTLYRKLPFNPLTDFETVGLVTDAPMSLISRPTLEAKNFTELLAYIKKQRDKISLGNAGVGAASHLCGMLLMSAMDVPMTTIPYNGTGPAMTDLLGGQIDLMCDQTTNTTSHIKSGKVKVFGVTTKTRVKNMPDVPTLDEAGLKGFEVAVWHGIYAPKGTPKEIIAKLSKALQAALRDEKVIARFADLGTEPVSQAEATPEAHKKKLAAEIERWRPLIQKAGVYAD